MCTIFLAFKIYPLIIVFEMLDTLCLLKRIPNKLLKLKLCLINSKKILICKNINIHLKIWIIKNEHPKFAFFHTIIGYIIDFYRIIGMYGYSYSASFSLTNFKKLSLLIKKKIDYQLIAWVKFIRRMTNMDFYFFALFSFLLISLCLYTCIYMLNLLFILFIGQY